MLASTTDALNGIFREDLDDAIPAGGSDEDRLWKDVEVYRYMTLAADRVAKDVEGLYRIWQFSSAANEQVVRISRNVLHIRLIRSRTTGRELDHINLNDAAGRPYEDYGMQVTGAGVFTAKGTPTAYFRDYDNSAIRLGPIPAVSDDYEMQYTAKPGVPLTAGQPLMFGDVEDQDLLLHYMKYRAYLKRDSNTYSEELAESFKKRYDTGVLDRKSALQSYRRAPGFVACDWD